jgi:hypothetical protein
MCWIATWIVVQAAISIHGGKALETMAAIRMRRFGERRIEARQSQPHTHTRRQLHPQ